jgi:hypothetical protein
MARSWNFQCLSLMLHSFVSSRFASDSSKRDLHRGRDSPVSFFPFIGYCPKTALLEVRIS